MRQCQNKYILMRGVRPKYSDIQNLNFVGLLVNRDSMRHLSASRPSSLI